VGVPAGGRACLAGLVGVLAVGVISMFVARFVLKAPFFQLPRESATKDKEA
jgi:hypothetical protein